jgi:hypothetical protein
MIAHHLIKIKNKDRYVLTELGWLTGWSCIEVQSIIRLVRVISAVNPSDINAPTLLTLVQLTEELDQVRFPINKKSTHAEPAAWQNELNQQGVPLTVLQALSIDISEQSDATLRAKKAVACLIWITGKAISEIETDLTRFGGGLNGAAGPLRNVTSRTCDFLPIVARVAEIIHTGLDLQQRVARLIVRLEIGIPGSVIEIAKHTKTGVNRSDFQQLIANNLITIESIEKSSDEVLLRILTGNKNKLGLLRDAVKKHKSQTNEPFPTLILPKFEE